ncbi:MAG TPA: EamA family transporter [Mucilaginibacter sp.]|jgi:drug/metabolite transporter (DMT)-like permease|nr:EamA family transporter [Mucilaginibacter sp.]
MLKLAKRYQVDVYQAIVWNYSAAILLSWALLRPHFEHLKYAPVASYLALGLLLPFIFIVLGVSIRLSGIVRSEMAQRLSLLISIVAAFFIFSEQPTTLKLAGIALGFLAIIFTIPRQNNHNKKPYQANAWLMLLIVFAGFGVIDVLFKQIAASKQVSYNTSLFFVFVLAFGFSFIGLVYQVAARKMRFSWPHIFIGWGLGIANFGNILFYLKAHKALANTPSTVFSVINIGLIVAAALTGLIIFKEKLSLMNKIGIVIAIAAVIIIAKS